MRIAVVALLLALFAGERAEADIYVSEGADGSLTLSNIKRAGRTYLKVVREPVIRPARKALRFVDGRRAEDRPYADVVSAAASANGLPPALLHAVISTESRYNPAALSPKGAAGLMQLMPDTARDMGVNDVWDPTANIQGGARYLKSLLQMFGNDIPLAVAAYNAGPTAVSRNGRAIPPYAETQRYVPSVLEEFRRLQGLAPNAPL
ncbi:Soluble lytic murein transglycosylase precursor [compost metagenome]